MDPIIPTETGVQRAWRRWANLKNERATFEPHWRDLAEFLLPRRGRWTISDSRKDPRSNRIINSVPTIAARTLASGMMAGLTSPARPWFRLTVADAALREYGPVKQWLWDVANRMRDMFLKTNLYAVLPSLYLEQGVFGTAAMVALEDPKTVLRFSGLTIGSYWVSTNSHGRVDALYRRIEMTIRQQAQEFGTRVLSQGAKSQLAAGTMETKREVLHVVEPNEDYDPRLFMTPNGKAYRSCYYDMGSTAEGRISESDSATLLDEGFSSFPAMVPRWDMTQAEESYGGSCPAMLALGDIKALQLQEKRKAQAIDKFVDPPMLASTSLRNSKVSLLPGDVTYVDPTQMGKGFEPVYQVKPEIQHLLQDIGSQEARIKRAFFEDLFLMLSQGDIPNMTATEVAERHEEKLLALGPVLERQSDDLLDPLIDLAYMVMARRGLLPQPPREMAGMALQVEYIGILAQAQRAVSTGDMERFSGFASNLAAVKPEILDNIDFDHMIDEYAEARGISPKIIVPPDQVQQIRAQRAQQQRIQQMAEMAPAMKDGAQAAATAATTVAKPGNMMQAAQAAMANIPGAGGTGIPFPTPGGSQ